jgi:soluble lytic murein transglycosylase-like protein
VISTQSGSVGEFALCAFFLASIATGCTSASPVPPRPEPPVLKTIRALEPPPETAVTPPAEVSSAVAPESSVPAEMDSLAFTRTVLEREASRKLSARQREAVARAIVGAEAEYGLPAVLALAIMRQESRFNPAAKGPAGSMGLMQLQPATARETASRYALSWKSERTLLDPEQNTRLGLAYLAELQRRFGGTEHAVAAYNIGPARLRRLLTRGPLLRGPYLTKIYAHVDALLEEYGE